MLAFAQFLPQAQTDRSRWGSPSQVVVETNAGNVGVVEAVLKGALVFLEAEMTRIGIP